MELLCWQEYPWLFQPLPYPGLRVKSPPRSKWTITGRNGLRSCQEAGGGWVTRVLMTMGDMGKREERQTEEVKRERAVSKCSVSIRPSSNKYTFHDERGANLRAFHSWISTKLGDADGRTTLQPFCLFFCLSSRLSVNQRVRQKWQLKSSRFCFCLFVCAPFCLLVFFHCLMIILMTNDLQSFKMSRDYFEQHSVQINCYLYVTSTSFVAYLTNTEAVGRHP